MRLSLDYIETHGSSPLIDVDVKPLEWRENARCRVVDPETFFPRQGQPATIAKMVCASCAVRDACLSYALEANEKFGVWGGTTEHERRQLRKERGLAKVFGPQSRAS